MLTMSFTVPDPIRISVLSVIVSYRAYTVCRQTQHPFTSWGLV
jgi:hypothetical protein